MKAIAIIPALIMAGCTTSHTIGNLQNDCDPGFLSPSVCLVTAKIDNKPVVQYPISGSGFLGITIPAAAMVGGAALIGPYGLARSGNKTTNNVSTNSAGGAGTGGTGGTGGAGGTGTGGNSTGGVGGGANAGAFSGATAVSGSAAAAGAQAVNLGR